MESVSQYIHEHTDVLRTMVDEDELIKKLDNGLKNGGDIDFLFPQTNFNRNCLGTILHFSVMNSYKRVLEYALNRGANPAIKILYTRFQGRNHNALEVAVRAYSSFYEHPIFEMLKKRSLELYSSFGLTSFHIDCARRIQHWSDEDKRRLQNAEVINASISTESPFWPGMTPILIAAKLENPGLVKRLLNFGANPHVRDPEGNTPLHYATSYPDFFDERLFALDGNNTFGSFIGSSHFHIACQQCPQALSLAKYYLDQGISPNSAIRKIDCDIDQNAGKVGLHIAAKNNCVELARLLLEYGAKIDQEDLEHRAPVECIRYSANSSEAPAETLLYFIEAGANQERISNDQLDYFLNGCTKENQLDFLRCIKKMSTLNKNLVSERLWDCYMKILVANDHWDVKIEQTMEMFLDLCLLELRMLNEKGLLQMLMDAVIVKDDFKEKFGWLDSFQFKSYTSYGNLLKLRFKRKLVEYEKKRKFRKAVPLVQWLFQYQGHLPYLCSETILRNMSDGEIAQFLRPS